MAKDFESLKQQALVIKNEVEDGANSSERVGGMLEDIVESMKLGTTEFNVSAFFPTGGTNGSNKYDLASAIGKVPAELRTAGVKVSFLNEFGNVESWEFSGGSWAVGGFSQVGSGKLGKLEQKTLGILEKSAEATQGKALQIIQDGYWEKGTVVKLSVNSDDAQVSSIAFGVMYPSGEELSVATPNMNKVGEYMLTDECTRIRVYIGTVSKAGTVTMKIETNGLQQRISKIESTLYESITENTKNITASAGSILVSGFWYKGTKLYLSLNSDEAVFNNAYWGVTYPTGEVQSVVITKQNKVGEYILTDDCTQIRAYADGFSTQGNVTLKVETDDITSIVNNIENQVEQLNEDVPLLQQSAERLENTVYGKVYEQTAEATHGKALQIVQDGFWAKGTVLKLSLNSDDAQISVISFGVMYPTGEVLNVATPSMNQVGEYTLTDDCTRIRVWASTVSQSGTATMKIETNGVRNNEFISNYIFGSYYKRKDNVNEVGTFFQKGLSVNLRKGTNVKITFNGTAQIDYAVFALKYPNGEIQNLYNGGINREFNVVLEDDCTNIRYFIHNVISAGNVEFVISSEPQINAVQINGGSMSILGDSYSTYGLWIPEGNSVWYGIDGEDGNNSQTNNVNSVTQTWWYKLCKKLGVNLMLNESYSGSTICNTGYSGGDASATSFIHRMINAMGQGNALKPKPNIIILFGATNDSWANSPLGELKYSDWSTDDLKNVLPAICYMFYYVQKWNPGALILNVVNTGLKTDIVNGFREASEYYGIHNIELVDIEKQGGHPSINGMESICNQIYQYIKNKTKLVE